MAALGQVVPLFRAQAFSHVEIMMLVWPQRDTPMWRDILEQQAISSDLHRSAAEVSTAYGDRLRMAIAPMAEDVHVSMVDAETVSIDLLATNRAVTRALRPGDVRVHTASSPAFVTFSNLTGVTPHVPPPLGRELQWRAVAHTATSLRSLTEPDVLRAILDVYNLHAIVDRQAARANELRVAAIRDVRVRPEERLYRGAAVRGVAIDVDLDDEGFAGDGDLFLFSAVLERLLGEHVSINSFSHATFRATRSKLEFRWRPRNGNMQIF